MPWMKEGDLEKNGFFVLFTFGHQMIYNEQEEKCVWICRFPGNIKIALLQRWNLRVSSKKAFLRAVNISSFLLYCTSDMIAWFQSNEFPYKENLRKTLSSVIFFCLFRYLFWHSMGYQFSVQKMHERAALVINYKVHHLSPKCLFALKSAYFVSRISMRPLIWILSFNCHHQIWK